MSDLFPPINESARVNTRYQPVDQALRVSTQTDEVRRVYADLEIIDTIELTTYDRSGSIKTVVMTSRVVDFIV
jgi:hypothetical protein